MKKALLPAVVVAALALGSIIATAAPAAAATTIDVSATYQLNTNQGPQQRPLDPASQTDVTSGNTLLTLTITNNDTETYTLDSVTPTTPANQCTGTIAPGTSINCYVSPTFGSGAGVLDLTLAGSFPTAGPDTTVVSFPYFGVDYAFTSSDFAVQAPPPATGWLTTIPDPQLLSYPGLFRPLVRLTLSWNGNTPVTITRATAALVPFSDQCFGTLPKVVNPGDPIMSCTFEIGQGNNAWGFQYTGAMGEQQAYAGSLSYMAPSAPCQPDKPSYTGGETITVTCSGMAAGVSAQMRVWNAGVSAPQTIAADGTVTFTFALPTITSSFASGSLLFREGGDPAVEFAGQAFFTIDPGVATAPAADGGTGTTGTAELADSGSDVSGPLLAAVLALVFGGVLLTVRRRHAAR